MEYIISSDITKNILSEYLEYDQAKELKFLGFYANPKRIKIEESISRFSRKSIYTYVDNKLIKQEVYNDKGNIEFLTNFKDGKHNGKCYSWYDNGNLCTELNICDNAEKDMQYYYRRDGKLNTTHNYLDEYTEIKDYIYDETGNLIDVKTELLNQKYLI